MSGRLLIGLGNELRGDDAAGLLVARAARGRAAGIDVVESGGEPIDLLDSWEGFDDVVVADAVSSGAEPGTVHRIDAAAGPLPTPFASPSTHALGLAEAVELGRALDRLPTRLVVFGIEGALGVPVRFVGVGEGIGDLLPFDPDQFVRALFD